MAVTANQIIQKREGRRSYPVAASVRIYEGTLVFLTATGYATDVTASGVNGFLGVAVGEANNSSGSAGDITVEVWPEGEFVLEGTGFAQSDVGSTVYAEDNYTVGVSISTASVPIGMVTEFISSTKIRVDIDAVNTGALPVAPLTTITHTNPSSADYAFANTINSSAWGFSTQDEANTLLSVVRNLQIRVLELENRGS
jgi:hypothetical protein